MTKEIQELEKKDKLEEEVLKKGFIKDTLDEIDLRLVKKAIKLTKLSQRKEDIEMFEKMIDECICICDFCIDDRSRVDKPPIEIDVKELKQKLGEMK